MPLGLINNEANQGLPLASLELLLFAFRHVPLHILVSSQHSYRNFKATLQPLQHRSNEQKAGGELTHVRHAAHVLQSPLYAAKYHKNVGGSYAKQLSQQRFTCCGHLCP